MSEMVSTLYKVTLKGSDFIVIVTNECDYSTPIQKVFEQSANTFGEMAGPRARIVRTYKSASHVTYRELVEKVWPMEVRDRFDNDNAAVLVFIKAGFANFDPRRDDWVVVWLSAFGSQQHAIPNFFNCVSRELKRDRELFAFLRSKIDGADRAFPRGCLSARGGIESPPATAKNGREGILDNGDDFSIENLAELMKRYEIDTAARGWKTMLCEKLAMIVKRADGRAFEVKSIRDALAKNGKFAELERRAGG